MRDRLRSLPPSVLALSLVLLLAIPAVTAAQTGLPATISMHPESAGPGATVEVTGLDFPGNSTVSLQLSTPDGPVNLATVATSGDGTFQDVVTLPANVALGTWSLQARAPSGATADYIFDSSAPVVTEAEPEVTPKPVGNTMGDIIFMLIFASILGVVFTGILFAYRLIQEERSQPGMGTADDLIWSDSAERAEPVMTIASEPHWKRPPETRPPKESEPAQPETVAASEQEVPASA